MVVSRPTDELIERLLEGEGHGREPLARRRVHLGPRQWVLVKGKYPFNSAVRLEFHDHPRSCGWSANRRSMGVSWHYRRGVPNVYDAIVAAAQKNLPVWGKCCACCAHLRIMGGPVPYDPPSLCVDRK